MDLAQESGPTFTIGVLRGILANVLSFFAFPPRICTNRDLTWEMGLAQDGGPAEFWGKPNLKTFSYVDYECEAAG